MGVTGGEPLGFNLGAQGPGGTLPGLDLVSSEFDEVAGVGTTLPCDIKSALYIVFTPQALASRHCLVLNNAALLMPHLPVLQLRCRCLCVLLVH